MYVTIINDCSDPNAMNRQATRMAAFLGAPVFTLGVTDFGVKGSGEIEAAGNIIDTLDAAQGEEGVILVNVAIRHGKGKRFPNGTPFGYFYYGKTLIVSSIDGYCLSLIKKLGLADTIHVMDIPTVIDAMIEQGHHKPEYRRLVVDSQFRSFEFIPRVAKWLKSGIAVPATPTPIAEVVDMPACIWWVDNFGNCVTSLLPDDIQHEAGKVVKTVFGDITCYERLKDVPNGEPGFIVGSWGIENRRFLGLVIQGQSFAQKHNVISGTTIFE
jgi:hypothetical protein